jgi:hypothetical protein
MPKFPEPPAHLPPPQLHVIPSDTPMWRIYFTGRPHPTSWNTFRFWGPTSSRFDHHPDPPGISTRGILYTATGNDAFTTCIAEVFQGTRTINTAARQPRIVSFRTVRDLRLLDLTGTWPTQAGASMAISSGARPRARRWSQAIYAAFPDVDGIHYGSSMNANQPAQALFERAHNAVPLAPTLDRALADAALVGRLAAAAHRLNYRI